MIIPFFGAGQKGKSSTVTMQSHLNLYAEVISEKSAVAFYGTPGLTLRKFLGDTPVRGWITSGNFIYLVHRGTFYRLDNSGTLTSLGALNTTSGRVDMAYNGFVILIVDGTNGYTFTISGSTFAQIVDADFPNGVTTCSWLFQNFAVAGDGTDQFFISPTGTAWDALDFASAESNPDGIVRIFADSGELILFGENTIEFQSPSGSADFAFTNVAGSSREFGLAAKWSVCKFNSGVAALMRPRGGQVQMMFLSGYNPKPISTPEMDSIFNGYANVDDATAYSYMLGGHPMLQVNFPSAMKSWLYDATTNMWSSLEYGLSGERHRGEMQLDFLNKTVIADYSDGSIYDLDPDVFTDNGTYIAREIISRHVFRNNSRTPIHELYVDMEVGVGLTSGQGADPQVMLSVSKNNGMTWGPEKWKSIGEIGKYITRVVWRRLGISRDWLFKLRVTDPVKVVFVFGDVNGRNFESKRKAA